MATAAVSSSTKAEAETYLQSLISKTLRITTIDKRMFLGQFKCTDSVSSPLCDTVLSLQSHLFPQKIKLYQFVLTEWEQKDLNVILTQTHEYTPPSPPSKADLEKAAREGRETIKLDMTSRFLGLVVVPGEYITKIEVEEFASQLKNKR